jgi:hypothetical protein
MIISLTKKDKNPDFIPWSPFPDYDPKTTSGKRGYFGAVEWEMAC